MNARRVVFALSASLFVAMTGIACGGAPPAEPQVPSAANAPVATAPQAPPDLSAVDPPKNLIFFARINRPVDSLKTLAGWTHLPMPGADVATEMLVGESIGNLIDLSKPVDVVVASDPSKRGLAPVYALAAGLTSMDAAKTSLARWKLVPKENGALLIQGLGVPKDGASDDDDGGDSRACEIAPAAGPATARLVCAPNESALRFLAPFLTRTLPRQETTADIHAELRMESLKSFVALGRAMGPALLSKTMGINRASNPALADLVEAAMGELADFATDMDQLTIDAKLDDTQALLTTQTTFHTASSLTARMATSHADRVDVPPAAFWQLPGDADIALFNRGVDVKDLEHPRDLLLNALTQSWKRDGLSEADGHALTDALAHVLTSAPVVMARGIDGAAVQNAARAVQGAKDDGARADATQARNEQYLGWWVFGVDEPVAHLEAWMKELMSAWNRPGTVKWMKDQAKTAPTLKLVPVAASAQLPKGTTHLELTTFPDAPAPPPAPRAAGAAPPPKRKAAKPIKLHAFLVPDAARAWLVVAANEGLAVAKAKAVLTPGGGLAAHAGLEGMKDARVSSGGFVSLRGLMSLSPATIGEMASGNEPNDPLRVFASMSDQGATPIVLTATASPGTPASPPGTLSGTVKLPRAAIEDAVRIAMRGRF